MDYLTNKQKIEKQINDKEYIDIIDIFLTIQGEGPYCGHPAVFIRLAGCNLQCPGCDTQYTEGRKLLAVENIINRIENISPPNKLVVITGGEPLRQNLSKLLRLLVGFDYKVQIETNGSIQPMYYIPSEVTVVCSPKTPKLSPYILERADHFKYVINHASVAEDGLPISVLGLSKKKVARPLDDFCGNIYVQPADVKNEIQNILNMEAALKSSLKHGYILQLQIHKILGVD